ncbi:MAG TPA: hypothetical protein VGH55_04290 [Chthoniobacterales bacterium]|jgi:hypothetical protein
MDVLKGIKTVEELQDYPVEEEPQRGRRVKVAGQVEPQKAEPPVIPEPNVEPDPSSSLNSKNPLAKVKLKLAASHINEVSFLVV